MTGTWMFDKTELGVSGLQGFKDPAAIPDAQERGFSMRSQAFVFSETHTFSPTLVNSARFDYLTDPWTVFEPGYNPSARWIEKLGLKNTFADLGFPPFRLTGYMPIGSGSLTSPNGQHNSDYMDDLMWVRGKHTLKFGNHTMWIKGITIPSLHPAAPITSTKT